MIHPYRVESTADTRDIATAIADRTFDRIFESESNRVNYGWRDPRYATARRAFFPLIGSLEHARRLRPSKLDVMSPSVYTLAKSFNGTASEGQ